MDVPYLALATAAAFKVSGDIAEEADSLAAGTEHRRRVLQ